MKAVLKFDLNKSDDRDRHQLCLAAFSVQAALFDIIHNLRGVVETRIRVEETSLQGKPIDTKKILDIVESQIKTYTEDINHLIDRL